MSDQHADTTAAKPGPDKSRGLLKPKHCGVCRDAIYKRKYEHTLSLRTLDQRNAHKNIEDMLCKDCFENIRDIVSEYYAGRAPASGTGPRAGHPAKTEPGGRRTSLVRVRRLDDARLQLRAQRGGERWRGRP